MHDVIVIGGGFAGVTAAREVALAGRSALLLEAKDRLGGRTWTADWNGQEIEYGGGWVHWHQPHAWSEMTRGGIGAVLSDPEANTSWWVGGERRTGTAAERDAIAERGLEPVRRGFRGGAPEPVPAARRRRGDGAVRPADDPGAHRRARARRRGARGAAGRVRVARARLRARGRRVRGRPLARAESARASSSRSTRAAASRSRAARRRCSARSPAARASRRVSRRRWRRWCRRRRASR